MEKLNRFELERSPEKLPVTIRPATLEDLYEVQTLNAQLFQEELTNDPILNPDWSNSEAGENYFRTRIEANDAKHLCLLADVNGTTVGYLVGSIENPDPTRPIVRAELENTLVREEYRGKGVGKALFEDFKAWAKTQGAERLVVRVYTSNERASDFYENTGFKEISRVLEQEV